MPLLLHNLMPMHWAAAGAGIAAVTLALLYLTNRRLGFSSGFDDICSLVLRAPYFRSRSVLAGRQWRLPMLAGLVLGGALSAITGGGWTPTWDVGRLDAVAGLGPAAKMAWMFAGGLCIGFGTRLGGGCTSGHGIFGLSNFERASLVTTVSYMLGGALTTNLLYRVVFS
jgi:uncharacterized membrane protein YedE/YeeE